jgi:endo-1,4-beta-xylanase
MTNRLLWIGISVITTAAAQPSTTLKDAFKGKFVIGAALNDSQFTEASALESTLVKKHFNSITPENVMKWQLIHPDQGFYKWGPADRYVEFGQKNGMFLVGHTLIWHQQTPKWVFEDSQGNPVSRDLLLTRMSDHIHTVVGRYKGKIRGWDVVNEALNDDGTLRQTPWMRIVGEDYLWKAFQFAHEADPAAELYYNDYSLENPAKLQGAVKLIQKLRDHGASVTGVGSQTHANLRFPTVQQVDEAITELGKIGKVMITELDISVLPARNPGAGADVSLKIEEDPKLNPYRNGLPEDIQQALAQRYAGLFAVFIKHGDVISRVTFWGVTDAASWLNNWPIRGRTNYPLLFDRAGNPKPAFFKVLETAPTSSTP